MKPTPPSADAPTRERGFTLIELLVSLVLVAEILVAALVMFDFHNRLTRVQTNIADLQQSMRVGLDDMVFWARMAGRGGLVGSQPATVAPADPTTWYFLPRGVALEVGPCSGSPRVCGNAPAGTYLDPDDDSANPHSAVFPGTDVLILRGILSTPIYHIDTNVPSSFQLDNPAPDQATAGTLTVLNTTPLGGNAQDLEPLAAAIAAGRPEPILLVSPLSDANYVVVELDPANSVIAGPANAPTSVTLAFVTPGTAGTPQGEYDDLYLRLSANQSFSPTLNRVAFAGLLEEYRYYVRATDTSISVVGGEVVPRLARARVYPGTDIPHGGDASNWAVDIADNILDLQIALGIDSVDPLSGLRDERIDEAAPTAAAAAFAADEWLMNHALDNQSALVWNAAGSRLAKLRITVLARSARPDLGYVAPPIDRIEDSEYGETAQPTSEAERIDRLFRRRVLSTEIDLRNVG